MDVVTKMQIQEMRDAEKKPGKLPKLPNVGKGKMVKKHGGKQPLDYLRKGR